MSNGKSGKEKKRRMHKRTIMITVKKYIHSMYIEYTSQVKLSYEHGTDPARRTQIHSQRNSPKTTTSNPKTNAQAKNVIKTRSSINLIQKRAQR